MTSGKRAKQQRREALQEQEDSVAPSPATEPLTFQQAGHALGPHAGAFVAWQGNMKQAMLQMMEENRRALDTCTGQPDCPSSIHYPSCAVH